MTPLPVMSYPLMTYGSLTVPDPVHPPDDFRVIRSPLLFMRMVEWVVYIGPLACTTPIDTEETKIRAIKEIRTIISRALFARVLFMCIPPILSI